MYTAGHSTRTFDELAALLEDAGIRVVADVRRFPGSRRHPQHDRGSLAAALGERGIRYEWLGESLGGRRRPELPAADSPNRAWKVEAFRAYADAMDGDDFRAGIARLEALARTAPTAFLCAEKLWWRCHRRLVADLLAFRGWRVVHLVDVGRRDEHHPPGWARFDGGRLTYPGPRTEDGA